ncbi:MAG: hypothetical protein IIA91_05220 [Chloroflexi bacterium]|nr:hypothetical protein [Chloroflexota bacterium]
MTDASRSMTPAEFKERLGQLQQVIMRGLAYYAVWSKLRLHDEADVSWSIEHQNQLLGRFRGFFTPISLALMDMALMEFAKVFDGRRGTASLTNLLSAARQDASLVPGRESNEVDDISKQLRRQKNLLDRLRRRRNKWLAHVDANPGPVDPIMSQEIQSLAEDIKTAFNRLSAAHDRSIIGWDFPLRTSEGHTSDVLGILLEEIGRKQKEHQEAMVRIVLEDIRRQEKLIDRSLTREEVQSVKQSYGLTEDEVHGVEQQYASS